MGRVDQFRIKALNNAMTALAALPGPLAAPGNVDALKLGKKTTQKVRRQHNDTAANLMFVCQEGYGHAEWWAGACLMITLA